MPVTIEVLKTLSDDDLERFINLAVEERKARSERRKQETIAKIRELAESAGVTVTIGGTRGRPKSGKRVNKNGKQ